MIDLVYILGTQSEWYDNEIRLSLRSVEKYLKGHYNIYVVGYKPKWLVNVIHINCPDPFKLKPKNTNYKLEVYSRISENPFILMNDDFFFSEEINISDIQLNYCGSLSDRIASLGGNNRYRGILSATRKLLNGGLNFELHTPMPIFDRETFNALFKDGYFFNIRSMYGNLTNLDKSEVDNDVKVIPSESPPKPYFSIEDTSLSEEERDILSKLYPEKSGFEIVG